MISREYHEVFDDLEKNFCKVMVIPLQVTVMLSGFSANTLAAMAERSSELEPHTIPSMQPFWRVEICVFIVTSCLLFTYIIYIISELKTRGEANIFAYFLLTFEK